MHRSALVIACFTYSGSGAHLPPSREQSQTLTGYREQTLSDPPMLLAMTLLAHLPDLAAQSRMGANRRDVLGVGLTAAAALGLKPAFAAESGTTAEGVKYTIVKTGNIRGSQNPKIGDQVGIRFKGTVVKSGNVFDDILERDDFYIVRVGSGVVMQGVDKTLPLMKAGDIWDLEIPSELAFGKDGKPAAPGRPRIPADADVQMRLELVTVPGKDGDDQLDDDDERR